MLLENSSFSSGSLRLVSYARPGKLFTASSSLISTEIGSLTTSAFEQVLAAVIALIQPKTH